MDSSKIPTVQPSKLKMLYGKIIGGSWRTIVLLFRIINKPRFLKIGKRCSFNPINSDFIYDHITVGDYVQIGDHASFIASIAYIHIGQKVRFGPHVTIRGGNHRYDIIGKYIYDVGDNEKRPEDDQNVIIKDDVWVGTNVTILKGVTIGRGAIVAAGAVVTKDVEPYTIVGGIPAKKIGTRFSNELDISLHEKILYGKD